MYIYHSSSEQLTRKLGVAIGELLTPGIVIGLNGTLGAGKTRLTQAIGLALGIPEGDVVSPTYTLCTPHEGRLALLHLDAYRINNLEEVDELGLDELVESGAVLVVEWAERIESLLPPLDLLVQINSVNQTTREFKIQSRSSAGGDLVAKLIESVHQPDPQ